MQPPLSFLSDSACQQPNLSLTAVSGPDPYLDLQIPLSLAKDVTQNFRPPLPPSSLHSASKSCRQTMSLCLAASGHDPDTGIPPTPDTTPQRSAGRPVNQSAVPATRQMSDRQQAQDHNEEKCRHSECVPPPALTRPSWGPDDGSMTQGMGLERA